MKIILKATNLDISPSISKYVDEKIGGLDKFLEKFDSEIVETRVEVGKITRGQRQGDIFRAEVNLRIGGYLIRVEETEESLSAAIDLVKDELQRKIREYKDKQGTKFIRGARSWKKFWQLNPLARFRASKSNRILKK
jgi:ribosomal subunit interface protein